MIPIGNTSKKPHGCEAFCETFPYAMGDGSCQKPSLRAQCRVKGTGVLAEKMHF